LATVNPSAYISWSYSRNQLGKAAHAPETDSRWKKGVLGIAPKRIAHGHRGSRPSAIGKPAASRRISTIHQWKGRGGNGKERKNGKEGAYLVAAC